MVYPNIMVLLILLCVFPVTTCTCERCVSALRRVKTFLRTSCGQERLNGLTLLAMYRHVKIDLNVIIKRFAASGKRRVDFMHPALDDVHIAWIQTCIKLNRPSCVYNLLNIFNSPAHGLRPSARQLDSWPSASCRPQLQSSLRLIPSQRFPAFGRGWRTPPCHPSGYAPGDGGCDFLGLHKVRSSLFYSPLVDKVCSRPKTA